MTEPTVNLVDARLQSLAREAFDTPEWNSERLFLSILDGQRHARTRNFRKFAFIAADEAASRLAAAARSHGLAFGAEAASLAERFGEACSAMEPGWIGASLFWLQCRLARAVPAWGSDSADDVVMGMRRMASAPRSALIESMRRAGASPRAHRAAGEPCLRDKLDDALDGTDLDWNTGPAQGAADRVDHPILRDALMCAAQAMDQKTFDSRLDMDPVAARAPSTDQERGEIALAESALPLAATRDLPAMASLTNIDQSLAMELILADGCNPLRLETAAGLDAFGLRARRFMFGATILQERISSFESGRIAWTEQALRGASMEFSDARRGSDFHAPTLSAAGAKLTAPLLAARESRLREAA